MGRPISTGSRACASCQYSCRECTPDCPLAPFFPYYCSDFHNVRKLFGISNIAKALQDLQTFEEKKDAAESMIYQANARAKDLVGGCHRIISDLNNQIASCQSKLTSIRHQITLHQRLASRQVLATQSFLDEFFEGLNID